MKIKYLVFAALAATEASAQSFHDAVASQPDLTYLTYYISAVPDLASLFANSPGITVLAPNDAAFASLVSPTFNATTDILPNANLINAIITYHLLNGTYGSGNISRTSTFIPSFLHDPTYQNVSSGQVVNAFKENDTVFIYSGLNAKSQVLKPDIPFDHGLIHVVNAVQTLPQNVGDSCTAANLTDFFGAMQLGNQTVGIHDANNITVFVPLNAGFQRVNSVTASISDSDLARIVNYHVVPGQVVYSSDMKNETLPTMEGGNVNLSVIDGVAFVNSAKVVSTDLLITNGVIHVLADVLNPDNTTIQPEPNATPQPLAFGGANTAPFDRLTNGVETVPTPIVLPPRTSIAGGATSSPSPNASSTLPPVVPAPVPPPPTSATSTGPTSPPSTSPATSAPPNTSSPSPAPPPKSSPSPPPSPSPSPSPSPTQGVGPTHTARAGLAAVLAIGALMLNA